MDKYKNIKRPNDYELKRPDLKEIKSNLSIVDVARNMLQLHFVKTNRGNYLKTEEFSSMVFDTRKNIAFYNKEGKTLNVIELVADYYKISFGEALAKVRDYYINAKPEQMVQYYYDMEKDTTEQYKGIQLPESNVNNDIIINYLVYERGISEKLVNRLINENRLYEDKYHNCVFIGNDVNETNQITPVFGNRRGTLKDIKFQRDCFGSFKLNGFFLKGYSGCKKLIVTESVIDALSYFTLKVNNSENKTCDANILACSGAMTVAATLDYNLKNNEQLRGVTNIEVYTDHDDAGQNSWCDIIDYFYADSSVYNAKKLDGKGFVYLNNIKDGLTRPKFWLNKNLIDCKVKDLNDLLVNHNIKRDLEVLNKHELENKTNDEELEQEYE